MAANAKNVSDQNENDPSKTEAGALDATALENIDWEAVRAINPDLADLLEFAKVQNDELRATIAKGASEKKAREPQTLAARVNRSLTTEPKGLNKFGVLVANTGKSPLGDIDNTPILDGLRRAIIECGVPAAALDGIELEMGEHYLSFGLLVYNLGETRAWQPPKGKKGEKVAEPANANGAGEREDDDNEDDDQS